MCVPIIEYQELINLTGIDFATFFFLMAEFNYLKVNFSPYSNGITIVDLQHSETVCPRHPRLMNRSAMDWV